MHPVPIEQATVATERRERASAGEPPQARPRWLLPAVTAVTALAIVAAFLVVRAGGGEDFVPAGSTVARIDDDRFERPIAVGTFPLSLTEMDGRIWVTDRRSQVYWVSEADGSTGSTGTDGIPTGAAAGEGAVWVTAGVSNETLEPSGSRTRDPTAWRSSQKASSTGARADRVRPTRKITTLRGAAIAVRASPPVRRVSARSASAPQTGPATPIRPCGPRGRRARPTR